MGPAFCPVPDTAAAVAAAAAARSGHEDLLVSGNQSPRRVVGDSWGPAHLRTPLQLVLAQPCLVICARLPGQNR